MRIDKDNIKIILILLVVCLGIGYSYLNTDLNINGTANINSANWDVHWDHLQVTNGSVSGANVTTPATIQNPTTLTFSVTLAQPGDFYEVTVDAVNAGTIDAMLDSVNVKLNGAPMTGLPDYLVALVRYIDGKYVVPQDELKANTYETYVLLLKYRDDIEANQLPSNNQELNLQITITYRQATNEALPIRNYVYKLPGVNATYDDYRDLIEENEVDIFIRNTKLYSSIRQSDIGFVLNNQVHYLIGAGGDTTKNYEGSGDIINICYNINKATLQRAFGSSNCTEGDFDLGPSVYLCSANNFTAYVDAVDCYVFVSKPGLSCDITNQGVFNCDSGTNT